MMTNILYWMTQSYSTYLINHVTGDAKYSVLDAPALYHVKSYVTVDANYSIFDGAIIHNVVGNIPRDANYSVLNGATIPCY